jgi:hypothetical protein
MSLENVSGKILGRVDQEIHKEITTTQKDLSIVSGQIGFLEAQKYSLLQSFEILSKKLQSLAEEEGKRLGIEKGQDWHITQDGIAILGKSPEGS